MAGRPGRPDELSSGSRRRRHVHRPGPRRSGWTGSDAQGPFVHRQLRRRDRPGRARADGGGRHRRGRRRRGHPRDDRRHERDPRAPGRADRAPHDGGLPRPSGDRAAPAGAALRPRLRAPGAARPAALAAGDRGAARSRRGGPDAARPGKRRDGRRPPLREGVESIAIAFLHAYASGAHEQAAAAIVRERAPGVAADALLGAPARGARVRADEHGGHQRLRHAGHGAATSAASRRSSAARRRAPRSWSCSRTAGS